MANRIQDAINKQTDQILDMEGVGLNGQPLSEFEEGLDLQFDEFCEFQKRQSHAFAMGKITFDEAQTIYIGLGGESYHSGNGWPKDTSLAVKVILTKVCAELMGIN